MTRCRAGRIERLWAGELQAVTVQHPDGALPVVVINLDGTLCAYEDRCPHQRVALSRGTLDGATLTCSAHGWSYDARTGEGINPTGVRLRAVEVELDGDDLVIELPDAGTGCDG